MVSIVDSVYHNVVDDDDDDINADADDECDDGCHYSLSGQEKPYSAARETAPLGVRLLRN